MNPASLNVSHQSISSSTTSKTVAAILKQQKDAKLSDDGIRQQLPIGQLQAGKKQSQKSKVPTVGSVTISQDKLHYNASKNMGSPAGSMVGSPAMTAISPAMSPSTSQGPSPMSVKEHMHPTATKASSLSRDISPSRITAQMVKVMGDSGTSVGAPNLLLSALQGNMPDPMGILSASKTEGGLVSVVTATGALTVNNSIILSATRKSAAASPFMSSPDSLSSLQPQHRNTNFSNILTSMSGSTGASFMNQPLLSPDLDELDSTSDHMALLAQSQSTVDLLTAPSGSMQTVNVSHTPKSTIPQSFGSRSSSPSSSSPRPSARSAMEVAQQIKMEANGQSASAQRAALKPGMQQQLRSQIKSSRSIDAQLASRQNPGSLHFPPGQGNPSVQHHPNKESEQQKVMCPSFYFC